jgi:hypothetical protein
VEKFEERSLSVQFRARACTSASICTDDARYLAEGSFQQYRPSSDTPGRFHPPMEHSHDLDQTWRIALGSKVDHVALLRV